MSHNTAYRFVSLIIGLILLATISTPEFVHAAGPLYVATTGNNSNSCTSAGSPCLTINGALGKATSGDTIKVAIGTYTGSGTEVVLINTAITLSGGWNAGFTSQTGSSTIDGQGLRRGITINSDVAVTLERFIIQNGVSGLAGGGGIYIQAGTVTISNTTVNGNTAGDPCCSGGGGGGGIMNWNGTVFLNNSTISNNTLLGGFSGGGILNYATMTINNSTISGNTASAGIYNASGTMTINNTTVTANPITGIYGNSITLSNSIVAKNATNGPDCLSSSMSSGGYNLIGIATGNNSSCGFSATVGDLVGTSSTPINPGLMPLQDNGGLTLTHALMAGSPAIDAGNPAAPGGGGNACLATDQRGVSRPVGAACDMGAFEGQVAAIVVSISGNAGVAGATLHYTEATPKSVIADGSGNYTISVLSGWSGTVTPSKAGYSFAPGSKSYSNLVTSQTSQNYIASLVISIADPSFEAYTPNPYWTEGSTNFGTPLCTLADCGNGGGTAAPRTGAVWGWFGGTPMNETATLSQSITIPSAGSNLKLQFYFWIGVAAPGSNAADVFTAKIDAVTVFSANATQQSLYRSYTPILVDISAFADGASHVLTFTSVTTGQAVTFNLDDIAVADVIFADTPSDYWALQFIERLYKAGITGGCSLSPLKYCPETTVNRAQMAVFLLRGIHGSAYTPPAVGGSTGFTDVPADYWAAAWIKELAAEGITGGCGNGKYCPETPVTRDQMAVFLLRSEHGSAYSPPAVVGGTGFSDVPDNHWAAAWIKQLVTEGITAGCGGGNYCPNTVVTRAQMAVFLVRTFSLP